MGARYVPCIGKISEGTMKPGLGMASKSKGTDTPRQPITSLTNNPAPTIKQPHPVTTHKEKGQGGGAKTQPERKCTPEADTCNTANPIKGQQQAQKHKPDGCAMMCRYLLPRLGLGRNLSTQSPNPEVEKSRTKREVPGGLLNDFPDLD